MRWLRALPLGVLALVLLGTGTVVLRGPATAGWRVVRAPTHEAWAAAPEPARDPFATLLLAGSAVVLAAACWWLALAVAACTWEALRGGHAVGTDASRGDDDLDPDTPYGGSSFLRPRLVRALVATCLGAGVLGSPSAHAQSSAGVQPSASVTPVGAGDHVPLARLLEGLPLPDRAVGGAVTSPMARAGGSARDERPRPAPRRDPVGRLLGTTLEVAPGDSLWSLTARVLPDHAPVSTVAAGWPLLYAANRTVIGEDPDLLRPGQHLRVDRALTDLARSTARRSPTTSTTPTTPTTPTDRRSP